MTTAPPPAAEDARDPHMEHAELYKIAVEVTCDQPSADEIANRIQAAGYVRTLPRPGEVDREAALISLVKAGFGSSSDLIQDAHARRNGVHVFFHPNEVGDICRAASAFDALISANMLPTAAPEPGGWLPIESAPMDGAPVLAWFPSWNISETVFFADGGWWMMTGTNGKLGMRGHPEPTHWQSLPAPPAQAAGVREGE